MLYKKLLLPFIVMAFVLMACGFNINLDVEQGSGNVTTQTRDVSGFDRVLLSGIGNVTITQGNTESLKIEAEDNVIQHLTTEVKGGVLNIGFDNKKIIPTKDVKFYLTMKNIHGLETEGVSNIQSDKINTDALDLKISGTGNIDLKDLTAQQLTTNISGAGNFSGAGTVTDQKVTLSGAGNYTGEDIKSETADVTISGLGRVTVWATKTLAVTISGGGGVDYYGSPQLSQQISGVGKVTHKGDK